MVNSRREFLRSCGSFFAAAAVAPATLALPRPARRQTRVLVMGAGAAGLCAAYELDRAGYDVLVFEAKSNAGGRIHTVRAPFADGMYAEAGALFLSDVQTLTMHYARSFDLPLVPIQGRDVLPSLFHIAGRRIQVQPDTPTEWPVVLDDDERGRSFFELMARYRYGPFAALGLDPGNWPHSGLVEHDRLSLADYWRGLGASEGAIRILSLGYLSQVGDGPDSYSALSAMHDFASQTGGQATYQVEGGNDLLPRAFAARLGTRIHYGAPVVAIQQDESGVTLSVEGARGRQQVRGDFLICTAPFPVLRRVEFQPALSELRRQTLDQVESTSVTRIFLQCRERFWQSTGNGAAWTDLPVMTVIHATVGQPGTRGILDSLSAGERARHFASLSEDERIDVAAGEMARVHPDLDRFIEGGASVCWDNDPWALGDYAYFKPGQIERFFPAIQAPEGRVHFAGDTIGGNPGYIQSALLSARAAATALALRGEAA